MNSQYRDHRQIAEPQVAPSRRGAATPCAQSMTLFLLTKYTVLFEENKQKSNLFLSSVIGEE